MITKRYNHIYIYIKDKKSAMIYKSIIAKHFCWAVQEGTIIKTVDDIQELNSLTYRDYLIIVATPETQEDKKALIELCSNSSHKNAVNVGGKALIYGGEFGFWVGPVCDAFDISLIAYDNHTKNELENYIGELSAAIYRNDKTYNTTLGNLLINNSFWMSELMHLNNFTLIYIIFRYLGFDRKNIIKLGVGCKNTYDNCIKNLAKAIGFTKNEEITNDVIKKIVTHCINNQKNLYDRHTYNIY